MSTQLRQQLRLVPDDNRDTPGDAAPWRLSDEEKAVGLEGLAAARAALRQTRPMPHADAA
jgi:hypothetical protein